MKIRCLAVLLCAITCAAQSRDAEFAKLASRFFDEVVFRYDPVAGTSAGYHQYDKLLAPETSSEIKAQIAALHSWERDVQSFSPGDLSVAVTLHRDLVLSQIRGQLLSLETVRQREGRLSGSPNRGKRKPNAELLIPLREDYRKLKGAKFSLQEFHDSFLREGSAPIKLVRKAMLGTDSPVL